MIIHFYIIKKNACKIIYSITLKIYVSIVFKDEVTRIQTPNTTGSQAKDEIVDSDYVGNTKYYLIHAIFSC